MPSATRSTGAHTEDKPDPDPEHGAGAAQGDGHRHTDDIEAPTAAGQRRERSGNGTDLTLFLLGKHLAEGLNSWRIQSTWIWGTPDRWSGNRTPPPIRRSRIDAPEPVAEVFELPLKIAILFLLSRETMCAFSLGLRFVSVLSASLSQWVEGGFLSFSDASPVS